MGGSETFPVFSKIAISHDLIYVYDYLGRGVNRMIGRIIAARYKIISKIGQGTFGTTYLAEDTQVPPPSECVVKHFTPSSTEPETIKKSQELFAREATILHQLGKHPQIPRLLAYPQENQDFFIVQEYIAGYDLKQEIRPNIPLKEDVVIQLLTDILEVLVFIHEQEVIHRDLKPENIRRRQKDQKIVIIDFGAVKQISTQYLENQQPQNPTTIGTRGYTPIEQQIGATEFSSDIYAVGMIGIQALTGKHPKSLGRDQQVKLIWRDFVNVSDRFANFLDKMVEYNHTNRYADATEALTALQQISQQQIYHHQLDNQSNDESTTITIGTKFNPLLLKIASVGLGILVTGIITFVFINSSRPECDGKLADYQEHNIKLKYPECWPQDATPNALDDKLVTFIHPRKHSRLIISSFPYLETLDQLQNFQEQDITDNLTDGKVTKRDTYFFSGKQGRKIIATGRNGDEKIKNMYVMTLKENKAYVIIYSAEENEYDKFLNTVEMIIQSIEIE